MTQDWRNISIGDRAMFDGEIQALLLKRGTEQMTQRFDGDPLEQLTDDLLDSLFYTWVATREREMAPMDKRRRLFVDSIRHARVEMSEGMKNHPWGYGQFLTLLVSAVGQLMGASPENTGADFPLLRALARIVAVCEEWDEQDAAGYPKSAQGDSQPAASDTPDYPGEAWDELSEPPPKYWLTDEALTYVGVVLHRVQYRNGKRGGWIESHRNLRDNAQVLEEAMVWGEAVVSGDAVVTGMAHVRGQSRVEGTAEVNGWARIGGNARITDHAIISGEARVGDMTNIGGRASVGGNAWIQGTAIVGGEAVIAGATVVRGGRHGVDLVLDNDNGEEE